MVVGQTQIMSLEVAEFPDNSETLSLVFQNKEQTNKMNIIHHFWVIIMTFQLLQNPMVI